MHMPQVLIHFFFQQDTTEMGTLEEKKPLENGVSIVL